MIIAGQHEELLQNHGYISRHFIRRFLLPSNVEISALKSTINNGILTVTAPAAILPTQSEKTEEEDYQMEEEIRIENPEGSVSRNTEEKEYIEPEEEEAGESKINESKHDKE